MTRLHCIAGAVAALCSALHGMAQAVTFETETLKGSFDSTITVGAGRRLQAQSCALLGTPSANCSAADVNALTWAGADDGNLNYTRATSSRPTSRAAMNSW